MAKTEKPKKTSIKPIVDVAPPGKSAPSPNSKSIILNNHPVLRDPMVVDDQSENLGTDESVPKGPKPFGGSSQEAKLQPLTAAPKESAAQTPQNEPAALTKSDNTNGQVQEKEEESNEPASPTQAEPLANPGDREKLAPEGQKKDGADNPPTDSPEKLEEESAKQAKHRAAIEKLVESKQYYLSINSVEKRRSRRFVALGVIFSLLLIAAWVDIALDAGLTSNAANLPHTHFFDNQSTASPVSDVPAVTFKSFTTPVTKLTFRYPSSWQLDSSGSTATADYISVNPSEKTDPNSGILVNFSSKPQTNQNGSFVVRYVHYQKLPHKINGTVYLCDMVYQSQNKSGEINVIASITNNDTLTVGQQLNSIDQGFLNFGSQTSSLFEVNVIPENAAGSLNNSFASVNDAKHFIQSSADYQQARAILLSTAPAASQ